MAKDHVLQITVELRENLAVVGIDGLGRDTGDLGDDLLDLSLADGALLLALWQDALGRTRLIDDIDGLVWQVAVVDVTRGEFGRSRERTGLVLHTVVLLKPRLETLQNLNGLVDRGFVDIDLLEATRQGVVLLEDATVLVVGGGANAAQAA